MKNIFRKTAKTVKWVFIALLVYVASLFFGQADIPVEWVEKLVASSAPTNIVFHCDSASFGFRHGLRVSGIKVYDLSSKRSIDPVASVKNATVLLFERTVRLVEVKFPRLHDGYYEEGTYAEPLGDGEWDFEFPDLPEFTLVLEWPSILGVEPRLVTAQVSSDPKRLSATALHLDWRDSDRLMSLDGLCSIDLRTRRVKGEVRGLATQAQIRPMMVALDLPVVLPYMDGFANVTDPVPAGCKWDVNLVNNDFHLELDLHPALGRYNSVPMKRADGTIDLHVTFPGNRMDFETRIGPLVAVDNKDRILRGQVTVCETNAVTHVFFEGSSELPIKDVLDIIDYMDDGILDCLVCETPPKLTVKGVLAADVANQADNDLRGSISFLRGSLFGVPLSNASADFSYIGDQVSFTSVSARGKSGGAVTGSAVIAVPGLDAERASFSLDLEYSNGSLGELADFFGFEVGDKCGVVGGRISLTSPLQTNAVGRLNGRGSFKVSDGHLAQMKLFMGLTELLAKQVPGIDKIVNQSEASCTFTIENGVIHTDDVLIEGALFSISAAGTYDIVKDCMDFKVRVKIMRDDSVLGKYLIRPILWPFTRLLLEFEALGSLDEPHWKYVSVLDKML